MFKKAFRYVFLALIYSVIVIMIVYLTLRLFQMIVASYYWYDKLLGSLLLVAEFYIISTQGVGYLSEVLRVFLKFKKPEEDRPIIPELKTKPFVAILIPSYNEPLSILEDTIIGSYNLTYSNKHIYLLDDTRYELNSKSKSLLQYKQDIENLCEKYNINIFRRKWRGAKAGIINDYLAFVHGNKSEDFKLISYEKSNYIRKTVIQNPKYFVLLDADQNPYPEFVEPLVAMSEEDNMIALIQTPQYYTNFEGNRISKAAALQQVIFYEYLCVGKGIEEVMFCCGSNVLIRTEAIMGVGGFDETTVTEDFATSFKLHLAGWKTKYYNKVG
ncbi:MAG: Cellulose synthase 1, partial [Candidatus Anoxychlamydiales bacterium]|nr:Cellulose synthase 1 [Candidatus Anoxychlamydiales bacterium]